MSDPAFTTEKTLRNWSYGVHLRLGRLKGENKPTDELEAMHARVIAAHAHLLPFGRGRT